MSETIIYGPQNWTAGAISQLAGWWSTTFGGANAPIAGYPELAAMEQLQRVVGAGPSGENVVDKLSTHYYLAGFRLLGLGPLSRGQFDLRNTGSGVFHAQIKAKLSSFNMTDNHYAQPLLLTAGGMATDSTTGQGQGSSDWIAWVEMYRDGGTHFQWDLHYNRFNGSAFVTEETNGFLILAPDVADDRWVVIDLEIVPGTVTGAFDGTGGHGTGTVASDGSITMRVDSTIVFQVTSIALVVNRRSSTNADAYYGRGLQVGDEQFGGGADMPGQITGAKLYYSTSSEISTPADGAVSTPLTWAEYHVD